MFKSETKQKGKQKPTEKPAKNSAKAVDNSEKSHKSWYKHGFVLGILGLALFLVFVSIAYSVAVIWMGTKGLTPRIMTAPMIAFDLVLASIAFAKIFK